MIPVADLARVAPRLEPQRAGLDEDQPKERLYSRRVRALRFLAGSELERLTVPACKWLVRDIMPDRPVTLLSGDGSTGKSLNALLLVAIDGPCIGCEVKPGALICISAGDRSATRAVHKWRRAMSEPLVDAWIKIVRLPRGRTGQGLPEWQPMIRGVTPRGLRRTWLGPILGNRDRALAFCREAGTTFGLRIRSADVVTFRGKAPT